MNRFRFWHISDVPRDADDVRGWGQSAPRARVRGGLSLTHSGSRVVLRQPNDN